MKTGFKASNFGTWIIIGGVIAGTWYFLKSRKKVQAQYHASGVAIPYPY
jgi:cbb3-type cytochrome oxidase subunit 3